MNSLIIIGVVLLGAAVGALMTWMLLTTLLNFVTLRKMSQGDVEGVKKILQKSANRVSQPVRITAEVWLQNQRK